MFYTGASQELLSERPSAQSSIHLIFSSMMRSTCQKCGEAIVGAMITALGHQWHPEHFACAGCGGVIEQQQFYVHEQRPYHTSCYGRAVAPRCQYCGTPLVGSYLVDHWGKPFCARHNHEYPMCAFCGRLARPDGRINAGTKGDRPRCAECRAQAIHSATLARHPFSAVIAWFSHRGLSLEQVEIPFELCDRSRLDAQLGSTGDGVHLGLTRTLSKRSAVSVETEVLGISILSGLPVMLFQGVAAHELGHAWLHSNGIIGLSKQEEEGFCELLSFAFYVQAKGSDGPHYATCIERNPDPVYGDGFRQVREISGRYGFSKFLELLRSSRRMPS